MSLYQPTEEEQALVRELMEFRDAITKWDHAADPTSRQHMRSLINRRVEHIEEIVRIAGCLKIFTISPPPAIGGLVMQRVNPFNYIFEDVYGESLNRKVFDMLDQSIGVIESGKFQSSRVPDREVSAGSPTT